LARPYARLTSHFALVFWQLEHVTKSLQETYDTKDKEMKEFMEKYNIRLQGQGDVERPGQQVRALDL